jgi:dienelactone hydrolase
VKMSAAASVAICCCTMAAMSGVAGGAEMRSGGSAPTVARISLTLVDTARATPANGSYPGAPSRTLETVVSYPLRTGRALKGPLPLVVFATGIGGTATNYAPLYDHWVRAGYVVAAPSFPLSRENAPGGVTSDLKNQPGDVRFVTAEILRLARARGSRLHGLVDANRVALAGKSLGAITIFEAGFNPAERVPNVKAVIAMTGVVASSAVQLQTVGTPLLLEHGDADTTVPISGSRDAYARAKAPKFFVTLFGQTHGSAFGGGTKPAEQVVEGTTIDFLDRYVKGQSVALGRLQRDGSVSGVASLQASP